MHNFSFCLTESIHRVLYTYYWETFEDWCSRSNRTGMLQISDQQLLLLLLPHLFNGLFSKTTWVSRYQKGKTSLDLNEARDDGVLECNDISWTIMQTICTSLQTDNHTNTSPPNFYRPGALPDAQPTVSKHWRPDYLTNNVYNNIINVITINNFIYYFWF